ncbi:MAG: NADH-dependent flavin oxidoreductase, partial [Chloroflexi bacterium]|nr:NADH-dependent flavin oxidoreductase [Chloroflexota bacterium]
MAQALTKLFSPIKIGSMELKNRIVMAPMATGWAAANGTFSGKLSTYLEARARGGAALIITEVTTVDGNYPYVARTLGLWDDGQIAPMREFIARIHAHGTRIVPQIAHPGPESISVSMGGPQPVGPSVIRCPASKELCRELVIEEIPRIVEQFAEGARRAREAGFDGLELHAAHSYMLVGSFLSGLRNRRTDAYGGSLEGRLTLLLEVIKAIKARAGHDFPLIVRLSGSEIVPGGRDIRGTQYIVPILRKAGVDAFHISGGAFADAAWWILPTNEMPHGLNTPASRAVKEVTDAPVIVAGRIDDPRFAEDILGRNEADVIAMGRPLLADPELPNKAAAGRFDDIAPCTGCLVGCRGQPWMGKNITCVINPACGRERDMGITPAPKPRRVMIVGGGPGGMETARIAALRGHRVTLYEKDATLGGQLNLASVAPGKQELSKWVKYLRTQIEKAGVEVHLNTEVTPELVGKEKPDAVVIAMGGRPSVPSLPGIDSENVVTAHDVLAGKVSRHPANVIVWG